MKAAYSITDQESYARGARSAAQGGHLRRLVVRHAARRGAALLHAAEQAQARGQLRLRFRREVPLQGVQRCVPGAGGLDRAHAFGDLRDLVINRHEEGGAVEVRPQDTLLTVFARMRAADVSQLPVIEDDKIVGLVDESDLLAALLTDTDDRGHGFNRQVKDVMVTRLETISADAPIRDLLPLFRKDYVAIVMDGGASSASSPASI